MTRSLPHLALASVAYRYGSAPVLDRVDLAVEAGERVGILGRSGVGKSTRLQILAGLVPPSSGTVRVDGAPERSDHHAPTSSAVPTSQQISVAGPPGARQIDAGVAPSGESGSAPPRYPATASRTAPASPP